MDQSPSGSYVKLPSEEEQRASEEEMQRRKEAGFRQTDNADLIKFMNTGRATLERNAFNQTILWNCPNGTVRTP